MWHSHRFISGDKTPIHYYQFVPKNTPPKATILLIHGMGEHAGRYQPIAEYLGTLGIQSYCMDLRGFGLSGGKRACVGKFSDYHQDLDALYQIINKNSSAPVFLLGHSLGGLVAASYLAFFQPKNRLRKFYGLILSSPSFGVAIKVPTWKHFIGIAFSYVIPDFTQKTHIDPRQLTHDQTIINQYGLDPLIYQKVSLGLYRELMMMAAKRAEIASKISLPTLFLQAGEDFIVSKEASFSFFKAIAAPEKELKVYEGLYHEIFNETSRYEIFKYLGSWILNQLSLIKK